ncbi:MAG TPA: hypothetical protein VGN34_18520, partial [Ktedonobacteraceae bacterium]
MSGSTEESILGNIPGIDDDGGGGGHETGGGEGGQTSQGGSQDSGSSGGGRTSAQPTSGGQQGGGTDQGTQPVRRRHDGLVEVPNKDNPNTRDLVDPISGKVVANGGIERKIFEDGQRAQRENNQLKQQLSNATRQLSSLNEVTQEAVRLNVSPQDQVVAIRVMSDFMKDPVKTLEYLVQEVKSKGYPIPFLTEGVSQGMDLGAISRLIDNKMQPLTQQQQQQRQAAQVRQQAEADLNSFLDTNPEAHQNLDVLSEMLQAQPGVSLHDAFTKLIRWSHENGLDWTQGLKQQIAALRQQQPNPQQPTQQPNQRQSRPLPGGR